MIFSEVEDLDLHDGYLFGFQFSGKEVSSDLTLDIYVSDHADRPITIRCESSVWLEVKRFYQPAPIDYAEFISLQSVHDLENHGVDPRFIPSSMLKFDGATALKALFIVTGMETQILAVAARFSSSR